MDSLKLIKITLLSFIETFCLGYIKINATVFTNPHYKFKFYFDKIDYLFILLLIINFIIIYFDIKKYDNFLYLKGILIISIGTKVLLWNFDFYSLFFNIILLFLVYLLIILNIEIINFVMTKIQNNFIYKKREKEGK